MDEEGKGLREEGRLDILKTCKSDKQEHFDSRFLDEKNGKYLAMKLGYKRKMTKREESGLKDVWSGQNTLKNEENKM